MGSGRSSFPCGGNAIMCSFKLRVSVTFAITGKIDDVKGSVLARKIGNLVHHADGLLPREPASFDQRPSTKDDLITKRMGAEGNPLINQLMLA